MRRWLPIIASAAALLAAATVARAADQQHAVVYFSSWSALIDQPAHDAIATIAAAARQSPADRIALTGYASTVGSTAANTLLAQLRAQMVLDELVADGVAPDRITQRALGATNFVLDPIESRRVEITLGEP
jgi:outer membrane protein OmpA-like peptidoglycan-associated protein